MFKKNKSKNTSYLFLVIIIIASFLLLLIRFYKEKKKEEEIDYKKEYEELKKDIKDFMSKHS